MTINYIQVIIITLQYKRNDWCLCLRTRAECLGLNRNGGLNQILKPQTSRFHYGSKVPVITITVFITILNSTQHANVESLCVEGSLLSGLNYEPHINQRNALGRDSSWFPMSPALSSLHYNTKSY
jgi:hypothetical protein